MHLSCPHTISFISMCGAVIFYEPFELMTCHYIGAFGGTFYVMIAQKLAILLMPISIFYHAGS
jgi:hypothetical protein